MTPNTPADIDARDLAVQQVAEYHQRTKHAPGRYAAGPHGLDWDDQPNPFRRYVGACVDRLSTPDSGRLPAFAEIADGRITRSRPVDRDAIGQLFGNALATLRYSAAALGWRVEPLHGWNDAALATLLGIADTRYQVMYQFTVGGAVVDERIASEPAYST